MSKIADAFQNGKAFIPFLTCGDPDLETTEALVKAMAEAGADLIELGIPFSDPTAEGPVIQAANLRALKAGTTTDKVFELVRKLRETITIPMVFMTYANVVFSYGTEQFLSRAAEAGIQGLILPDVPFEEKAEFEPLCAKYGLELVSMIAPTSHERIRIHCRRGQGLCLLRVLSGRHRSAQQHHHGYWRHGKAGQRDKGYSLPLSASASPLRNRPGKWLRRRMGSLWAAPL